MLIPKRWRHGSRRSSHDWKSQNAILPRLGSLIRKRRYNARFVVDRKGSVVQAELVKSAGTLTSMANVRSLLRRVRLPAPLLPSQIWP